MGYKSPVDEGDDHEGPCVEDQLPPDEPPQRAPPPAAQQPLQQQCTVQQQQANRKHLYATFSLISIF